MNYRIKDEVYERIENKFKDGTFTSGNNCRITKYYFEGHTIHDFPIDKRTPEVCSSLMDYSKCRLSDVPKSSQTREFFIATFTNKDVFYYIKINIEKFDRQFFKDLIVTNEYATHFDENCFEVMPLEYIDEEMCSLAILHSTDWSCDEWFKSVYRRKPEALTADIWKLGARLYSRMSGDKNPFLNMTPDKYKDEEYYREMCRCNYNCGMTLDTNKGKIMDSIPQEVLTPEFLLSLLAENIDNIARFNEYALETEIDTAFYGETIREKIWKFVVRNRGEAIKNIPLNDERIEFFLSHYDKDTFEYIWCFKDNYKRHLKEKNQKEQTERIRKREQEKTEDIAIRVIFNALAYSLEGENPNRAIEDEVDIVEIAEEFLLPIKYCGIIPEEYRKIYDSEEYLEMLYKEMGIQIIEEDDRLFYRVNLPKGWIIKTSGYQNYVKDEFGNIVIEYFYDSKFYDRDAYVKDVYYQKEDINKKVLSKIDKKRK